MLEVLIKAVSLVAIIGIGLLAKCLGWLTAADFPIFSRLVLTVTRPAALVTAFREASFEPSLLMLTVLSFGISTFQQLVGYLLRLRQDRRAQAFAVLHSGGYNIGTFATPYLAGIMGPQAMLYTTMFDIGVATSGAAVGYGWATSLAHPETHGRVRQVLKALGNPVLIAYLGLLMLLVFEVRLPAEVIGFTGIVGAANPFLAMLMIGIGLELRIPRHTVKQAFGILAFRYAVAVAVALATWFWMPGPADIRALVCALWFAPLPSMASAFTGRLSLDVEASAFITSVSILVGIVAIPVVLLLAG